MNFFDFFVVKKNGQNGFKKMANVGPKKGLCGLEMRFCEKNGQQWVGGKNDPKMSKITFWGKIFFYYISLLPRVPLLNSEI